MEQLYVGIVSCEESRVTESSDCVELTVELVCAVVRVGVCLCLLSGSSSVQVT